MIKILLASLFTIALSINTYSQVTTHPMHNGNNKPYTRWWWFASEIKENDIREQLDWLKSNGFGGVEIAFVYPLNRMIKDTVNYTPRQEWLGKDFSSVVSYAKNYSDEIGLGCDFTFGTLWPFGDSKVPRDEASCLYGDTSFRQEIKASWEYPRNGFVINHLDKHAFINYASRLNSAFGNAYKGSVSSLFCDSWEVETKTLWTPGFEKMFSAKFGYDIIPFIDNLWKDGFEMQRYDYFKLLSELVLNEFYVPFVNNARENNYASRVQVMGAPVDIITAYSIMDIPETEAMLYEPNFSRVVASSALLGGKIVITSETFTCLYGWPREYLNKEQTADLKLVSDALFANGTNHIIWHGMPFNPAETDTVRFYATVHVGKKGNLSGELKDFNNYMEKISGILKLGKTYSDVAMYLPLEDSWVKGEYPPEKQMKWSWGQYELRYVYPPDELKGYHPLWINGDYLEKSIIKNGKLFAGGAEFNSLYIDVEYIDYKYLIAVYEIAKKGFPVCIKRKPIEPGFIKHNDFQTIVESLYRLPDVSADFNIVNKSEPLISGDNIPDYWCRKTGDAYYIFFANPHSSNLKYPLGYGQSKTSETIVRDIGINYSGKKFTVKLEFKPYQSLLLKVSIKGVESEDIIFNPVEPVQN
jgi:hypothetical protein